MRSAETRAAATATPEIAQSCVHCHSLVAHVSPYGIQPLIDLHCHLLPGVDDGARDLDTAVAMARMAVEAGVTTIACTPHISPGVYNNNGPAIRSAVRDLTAALAAAEVPLQLVAGADVHIAPNLIAGLEAGTIPTLGGSRYLLLELPHNFPLPKTDQAIFALVAAGYHPILTHPERLAWIEDGFELIARLVRSGIWVQITAGSLCGRFGRRAHYWSERLLDEGFVHILASDAHDTRRRPPGFLNAVHLASQRVGEDEAKYLVITRPQAVLSNAEPLTVLSPPAVARPLRGGTLRRQWNVWGKKMGWC